ncbi:hypothetical protein H072_2336 [Dactylellina haptotyla CBS 200.50]|uniref:Uncharacterized protein n=1 Tax=Dactylellina haptotyla (strain CBS 200.50) TaxID=1284197 RepID=S8AL28_DACHA|nr:hypothetical protein H072_2336 [Dactylellina haptotyla CBS 200.50]
MGKEGELPTTPKDGGGWWLRRSSTMKNPDKARKPSWVKKALGRGGSQDDTAAGSSPPMSPITPTSAPDTPTSDGASPTEAAPPLKRNSTAPVAKKTAMTTLTLTSKAAPPARNMTQAMEAAGNWNNAPLSPPAEMDMAPMGGQWEKQVTVASPPSPPSSRPNSELISPSATMPSSMLMPSQPTTTATSSPPAMPLPRPPSPISENDNKSDGSNYSDDVPDQSSLKKSAAAHSMTTISVTMKGPMMTRTSMIGGEDEVIYSEDDRLLISEEDWGEYVDEFDDDSSDQGSGHYTYDEGYKLIDQMYEDEDSSDDIDETYAEHELKNMMTIMDIELALKNLFPSEQFMLGEEIYAH